jgi:hypothetical protein
MPVGPFLATLLRAQGAQRAPGQPIAKNTRYSRRVAPLEEPLQRSHAC